MPSLEELFCHIDDFCQSFEPEWEKQLLTQGTKSRKRSRSLSLSETMTILVYFHIQQYRNLKAYYQAQVARHWRQEFPGLVSYSRLISYLPSALLPLCVYLQRCYGDCTGISFIDSTALKMCHNRRISQNRVFKDIGARGKTSVDWFFGLKLHLVVNECGELLNVQITPGNVDDRKPVPDLLEHLFGKVFGDKGYVSQSLATQLFETYGIEFFARPRRNMHNHLMRLTDKLLARHRAIIETIIDQLKNISQIEHSRHRSPVNCFVNILCGLIAYCHQPKKPSLRLDFLLPSAA